MKKKILSLGVMTSLLAVSNFTPHILDTLPIQVQAATEIDFERGSMSEEEYIKNIVEQFFNLDAVSAEQTDSNDDSAPAYSLIDFKNKAAYSKFEYDGVVSESYNYDDGSYAQNINSELEIIRSINVDNEEGVNELAETLEGKYIVNQIEESAGTFDSINEMYEKIAAEFQTYEEKDGVFIASTGVKDVASMGDGDSIYSMYPEGSTVEFLVKVNPNKENLVFETIIDVNEEAKEETSEDSLGISLSSFLEDSHTVVTMSPSTESVTSLEELDTITREEVSALAEEYGLIYY